MSERLSFSSTQNGPSVSLGVGVHWLRAFFREPSPASPAAPAAPIRNNSRRSTTGFHGTFAFISAIPRRSAYPAWDRRPLQGMGRGSPSHRTGRESEESEGDP